MVESRELRSRVGEVRAVEGEGNRIEGYAVVWDSLSDAPVGGRFWERFSAGCFDESLKTADVACLFDHESSKLLGRTSNGTLTLTSDSTGLAFSCELAPVSYAADVRALIARGDLRGCSFGFVALEEDWGVAEDGLPLRTVIKAELFDVSVVTYPTYTDTSVSIRKLDALAAERAEREERARLDALAYEHRRRQIAIAEIT